MLQSTAHPQEYCEAFNQLDFRYHWSKFYLGVKILGIYLPDTLFTLNKEWDQSFEFQFFFKKMACFKLKKLPLPKRNSLLRRSCPILSSFRLLLVFSSRVHVSSCSCDPGIRTRDLWLWDKYYLATISLPSPRSAILGNHLSCNIFQAFSHTQITAELHLKVIYEALCLPGMHYSNDLYKNVFFVWIVWMALAFEHQIGPLNHRQSNLIFTKGGLPPLSKSNLLDAISEAIYADFYFIWFLSKQNEQLLLFPYILRFDRSVSKRFQAANITTFMYL